MQKVIAFVGASWTGKSAVSRYVALKLDLKRLDFDAVCQAHQFTDGDQEEIINNIREYVKEGYSVIDVGGNTIFDFTQEQIQKLRIALGENARVYNLKPMPNNDKSFSFLKRQSHTVFRSTLYARQTRYTIEQDLFSPVYSQIADKTIYTLKNKDDSYPLFPALISRNGYLKRLKTIADAVIDEYSRGIPSQTEVESE